jgi:Flp pilus assembly protein TadD
MRSATVRNATLLGLVASGALLAGCSGDAKGDGGATPSPLVATVAPVVPAEPPVSAPEWVDPLLAKAAWKDGVVLFDSGDYAAASEKLRIAVAGESQDPYRHYLLGLAQWKAGELDVAEGALVESARLDAMRPKTWINLARVRNERGDRTGALDAADQAIHLDPTSADALHQRGRALMELGRVDEALVALTTARTLDADNGYIANTLGLLLIQSGTPSEAIEPLEAAKLALPHIAYVRNNLGVAYERTGRLEEAKIEYLAAVDAGDSGGKGMMSLVRLGATDTTGQAAASVTTVSMEKP